MLRTVWLSALVIGLSAPAFAQGWSNVPFNLFCGYPQGETMDPPWPGDTGSRLHYDRAPSDRDVPFPFDGTNCLDDIVRRDVLRHLAGAASWLEGLGLADPTESRLGPRVPAQPVPPLARSVRVYLADRPYGQRDAAGVIPIEEYGSAYQSCGSGATLAFFRLAPSELPALAASAGGLPLLVAHELSHVVQGAQPLFGTLQRCDEGDPGAMPEWVVEGLADALGIGYALHVDPSTAPTIADDLVGVLALRPFRSSLVAEDSSWLLGYRASSFWRWLVERYAGGDYALLTRVMATPLSAPAAPDWVGWLDEGLSGTDWGVGKDLTVVFPSFLASYAMWGDADGRRWPHVGNEAWRRTAFGGCSLVELSEGSPTATLTVELSPLAGACVEVQVSTRPLLRSSVQVRARSIEYDPVATAVFGTPVPLIDDLHLGVAQFGGTLTKSEPARCDHRERSMPTRLPACVVPAHTAQRDPHWGRVWSGEPREGTSAGTPYTDVLVFSRVPAAPTDASVDPRGVRTYTIEFALDGAVVALNGVDAGRVIHGANFRAPGTYLMPMVPSEDAGDGAPLDPSRLLFGQQAPGLAAMARTAGRPGLFFLEFVEADADTDDDVVGWSIGVVPEGGSIPYGATGTFRAALIGTDPARLASPGGVDDDVYAQAGFPGLSSAIVDARRGDASTVITVLEWDDLGVRADVHGLWCYGDELRPESGCATERTFEASVWLAFGDAYDGAAPYVSVDTPVQAVYRRVFGDALFGGGPGAPSFSPPALPGETSAQPSDGGGSSGAGAGEAGVQPDCDCSCAFLLEIDRLTEEVPPGALPPPELFGHLQCLMVCAPHFPVCAD